MKNFLPLKLKKITRQQLNIIDFPVYICPKLDGIRCCILKGRALTSALKPIPNAYIRSQLEGWYALFGDHVYLIDGELVVGKNFQDTSSAVMSHRGKPSFTYYTFDVLKKRSSVTEYFTVRLSYLYSLLQNNVYGVRMVPYTLIKESIAELLDIHLVYTKYHNYEGTVIRPCFSTYKFGKATLAGGEAFGLKDFVDSEATVIDFKELQANLNESKENERGYAQKSSHIDAQMPLDTLGSLLVNQCKEFPDVSFAVGSGFTDKQRKEIWNNKHKYIGRRIKFKYQNYGIKDRPREPVFLGFRDERDI